MSLSVSFTYSGNIKERDKQHNKQVEKDLIEVFTAPACTFSREPAIKTQKYD